MHNPVPSDSPPALGPQFRLLGWWLLPAAVVSTLWGCGGATESLWVDELHTSWTVSGDFSEVARRARVGNQSPVFFWFLYPLSQTLGKLPLVSLEWPLRLPSIACWVGVVFLCAREACVESNWLANRQPAVSSLLAIPAWLILDRVQLFYATEARVYSAVQFVSLLAWLAVWRMVLKTNYPVAKKPADATKYVWGWCGLSLLLIFLHITAVLAVVCQIVWGTLVVMRQRPELRRPWAAAVGVVALAIAAALLLSARVWEHREQWNSFAGEATVKSLFGLLPLVAYAVPVALARACDWLLQRRTWKALDEQKEVGARAQPRSEFGGLLDVVTGGRGVWWLAAFGPWVLAWLVTALDVAPIFHRRFVIVSAVPLVMLAAMEVARIRYALWRWGAVIGVAAWLIVSQGTLDNWRSGHWYGWQRWEGWRQASHALSQHLQPGDELWCASGLIEASGATLPLSAELNRYLSFPLRGVYAIVDSSGQFVEPQALLTSGDDWAQQLLAARPAKQPTPQALWIVYRGSPTSFDERLKKLRHRVSLQNSLQWKFDPPQAFGLVSLVRISVHPN